MQEDLSEIQRESICWFIFGGFISGMAWVFSGALWCITIVGIPYGLQCFKFATISFWPFGRRIEYGGGAVSFLVNVIWFLVNGWWMALGNFLIGVRKRIIIVNIGFMNLVMYNPVLLKKDTPYETEEGCLSLEGVRKTTRYQNIEVEYLDSSWKKHRQKFSGWVSRAHRVRKLLAHRARKWTAQIILHEMDHLEGVII